MPHQQGAAAYHEAAEPRSTSPAPEAKGKDWERIFEDPQAGLIPLIQCANSTTAIVKIMQVLVEQLFVRSTDHAARENYRAAVRSLTTGEASRAEVLERAIAFLREMKTDRIARSGTAARVDSPPTDQEAVTPDEPRDVEAIFIDIFLRQFRCFFDITADGVSEPLWGKLPFALSQEFAGRMISVVAAEMMPVVLSRTRRMLARIEEKSPSTPENAVEAMFADRKTRQELSEIWCVVWEDKTTTVRVPDAPEDGAGGLIGKLFGRRDKRPKWARDLTVEEWEEEVDETNQRNENALRVWSALTEASDDFAAPLDADWAFLMRIPVRSHEALQAQITAITQIAVQGASNTAFDTYQRDRNVDLALLISCYRYPDVFLGEAGFLGDIMRGYSDRDRKRRFPLTHRYLINPAT